MNMDDKIKYVDMRCPLCDITQTAKVVSYGEADLVVFDCCGSVVLWDHTDGMIWMVYLDKDGMQWKFRNG